MLYGELLATAPDNADIIHLLGVLAGQQGDHREAVARIGRAVALAPAVAEYRRNLSAAWEMLGRRDLAVAEADRAGRLLIEANRPDEAIPLFDRALQLHPGHRGATLNRAAALSDSGRHDEAQAVLSAVVAAAPDDAVAWNNLGNTLLGKGQPQEAVDHYRQALARNPNYAEAFSNLGLALARVGDLDEAERAARRALELREGFAAAHLNLGYALTGLARYDEVVRCFRRAIALQPDYATAHWNMSLALLTLGQFEEGWAEYEWRWRWPGFDEPLRSFPNAPAWRGEPPETLDGPLLVTAEQGFGDTIQFCRYAALLVERGHRVILEVQQPLHTLLWYSLGPVGVDVVARGDTPANVPGDPHFAAHVPLMSLPRHLGTTLQTIPAATSYLAAEPARAVRWRRRLGIDERPALRVGVVWAGRPVHKNDRERSIAAERLAPLAAIEGVELVSLQRGADERRSELGGRAMTALGPALLDFAETAAVVANLDLVISVDTAIVHLAGALGCPAWVLVAAAPDWRWLLERPDTPWYPSLRLYRQTRPGDWSGPIARIAEDLAALARRR